MICHIVPEVRKEKPFQCIFAETPCYTMMFGEVVLLLVALMYVSGRVSRRFSSEGKEDE